MNPKILLAFIGGAALASAIVYVAVRPEQPPAPALVISSAVAPKSAAVPEPVTAPPSQPVAAPPAPAEKPKPSPVKQAPAKQTTPKETPAPVVAVYRPAPIPQPDPPAEPPKRELIPRERPAADAQPPDRTPERQAADSNPPPPPPAEPGLRVEPPPVPKANVVTIPAGALISVRLGEALSAKVNQTGDTFLATLDQPLVVDGFVIAERGARAEGKVVEADLGGRARGASRLGIELTSIHTADGQHVRISTATFSKVASPSYGQDAAKIGAGAAIGAIIGGLAGGGKGAGIGAGVGGAAGAGDVLLTRGKPAALPAETRISFKVQNPVTITERD